VLVMDETPVKAGRIKPRGRNPGKMKTGFFWPILGDQDEVLFPFSSSRAHAVVTELLREFRGTLLTDGYEAYSRYAAKLDDLVHALCWSHLRRYFIDAETVEPQLSATALEKIGLLYAHEATIGERGLDGADKLEYRASHCKPLVDDFFIWLREAVKQHLLLPTSPFTRAIHYGLEREAGLRVFLANPDVPLDTNELERQIRPVAIGRRNWLFCWTEVGAKYVGIIHSLLATCKLQGVDPHTYLVDVLQRVATHPAREVHLLTPRLWRQHFADNPLRSDLDRIRQDSAR
jgi:transposase